MRNAGANSVPWAFGCSAARVWGGRDGEGKKISSGNSLEISDFGKIDYKLPGCFPLSTLMSPGRVLPILLFGQTLPEIQAVKLVLSLLMNLGSGCKMRHILPCSSKVREGMLMRSPYGRTPVPTLSLHSCPLREEHPGKQKQITEMQPARGLRAVEGETASYPTLSLKTRRDGDVKETLSRCPLILCSAPYARRVWTLWTAAGMWLSHGGFPISSTAKGRTPHQWSNPQSIQSFSKGEPNRGGVLFILTSSADVIQSRYTGVVGSRRLSPPHLTTSVRWL